MTGRVFVTNKNARREWQREKFEDGKEQDGKKNLRGVRNKEDLTATI